MGKRGPEPIQIDWDEFFKLVAFQCTQDELAAWFNCSVDTLDRACQRDLGEKLADVWHKKKALGRVKLRKMQMGIVEKGGPGAATMAIYLDKKMFPHERVDLPPPPPQSLQIGQMGIAKKTFIQFCLDAGYPPPYARQVEMREFGADDGEVRLLLGSRNYGKTDYVTILGNCYEIYCDWVDSINESRPLKETNLVISKSKSRNTSMAEESARILEANGVPLSTANSSVVRVKGLVGKDDSLEYITIRTSMRGRHHKRITMDDPVTEEDISEATRVLVKRKYNEAIKLSKNMIIIGQPAHAFDLYAELRGKIKTMEVPWGEIPELDADLEAMAAAGVDSDSISMSYHLKIPDSGTMVFSGIKYVDRLAEGPTVAFLDPSEGKDFTALSIFRGHFDTVQVKGKVWKKAWYHCDDLIQVLIDNNVKRLCFETNKFGDQPVEQLQTILGPKGIGVVGRASTSNKHAAIMGAGSYSHLICLSKDSDPNYTDQVIKYEYGSKFDDAPDSLARGLEWAGILKNRK